MRGCSVDTVDEPPHLCQLDTLTVLRLAQADYLFSVSNSLLPLIFNPVNISMASLKYFAAFLLTLELVAAVRPAQHEVDLEKPTLAKHESHGHESKLTQIE